MFNPEEEIQIIGYTAENLDLYSQTVIEQKLTELNEELTLKNRYNKAINKLDTIKKELERQVGFCENEAQGTVNDSKCRIAIHFYKKLLDIINER